MPTEKRKALEALKTLAEDATIEDAIEKLCFIAKVEKGLAQADAGEVTPHERVKERFSG